MSNSTNIEEVMHVETSSVGTKPSFPHMAKFMSDEYEELRLCLNEVTIATNVAYQNYPVENKSTSPWKKSHKALCNNTNGLFSSLNPLRMQHL